MNYKLLIAIAIVVGIILGYGFGYQKGARDMANWGVNVILNLMERDLMDVDVSSELIQNAIFQYKNRIDACLFLENETLLNS